jgi:hypothetical protein
MAASRRLAQVRVPRMHRAGVAAQRVVHGGPKTFAHRRPCDQDVHDPHTTFRSGSPDEANKFAGATCLVDIRHDL